MKKYLTAVMPAVCKDKKRVTHYNKIAVYQKGPYVACCATDGHRIHFAYSGGDLESWFGTEPTFMVDAKRVRKRIGIPGIDMIIPELRIKPSDSEKTLWGNGIWQIMQRGVPKSAGNTSKWIVNHKYMSDAFRSAIEVGSEKQVALACGSGLDMIWIYTYNYLAIVMPMRR